MRICKVRQQKGKKEQKDSKRRSSPVQEAPASCRPGDGPDIASPLSSEKRRKENAKGSLNI